MEPKEDLRNRTLQELFEQADRNRKFQDILEVASRILQQRFAMDQAPGASDVHYHIRWHPTERLDWESFGVAGGAAAAANELRLDGETYTIEPCDGSCGRPGPRYASPDIRRRAAS